MVCGRVFEIKAHSHILAHKTLQNAFVCVCECWRNNAFGKLLKFGMVLELEGGV